MGGWMRERDKEHRAHLAPHSPVSLPGSPGSLLPSSGLATSPGPSISELTVILLLLPMAVSSRKHELIWTLWVTSPSEEGPGLGIRISNEAFGLSVVAETVGRPKTEMSGGLQEPLEGGSEP